ncbi:MAG: SUMF1/EgtB/PvdO family nonheme iron enzyme [Planctomycetota bacterium]|nr:SUMF1/EgtB/PvdO family nonheme iron enzyme [Planctomycetota bacterium]
MLNLLPGDRLWNRYRVESVAGGVGGAWLVPLHGPPAGARGEASRFLLVPLERRLHAAPVTELLAALGAAIRLRATHTPAPTSRRRAARGAAAPLETFRELPALGHLSWVGDPVRDGMAIVAVPAALTLAEFVPATGPLAAPAAVPVLAHFAAALHELLEVLEGPLQASPLLSGVWRALARNLNPEMIGLRCDNAQLALCPGLPDPPSPYQPLPWADFLAPELYGDEEATPAACVFSAGRLAAFLLGVGVGGAESAQVGWAAAAEWAAGRRDPAREFLDDPASARVPAELRSIVAACLNKTPAQRLSAAALRDSLEALRALPWAQAGAPCPGCGFVLVPDQGGAACPCCGEHSAAPAESAGLALGSVASAVRAGGGRTTRGPGAGASGGRTAVQLENMVLVAAGSFLSGEHKVPRTLRAFAVDTCPVTEGEYKAFLSAVCRAPRRGGPGSRDPQYDRHPVTQVTWYEANEYAEFHGKRLPTMYEWEKAARGADGRKFPFGNTFKPGRVRLRTGGESTKRKPRDVPGTAPVGSHPQSASPYGVRDMVGNVLQWTSSARRAGERLCRAVKGSCYLDSAAELARCTSVQYLPPETSASYLGFRCVKDVE